MNRFVAVILTCLPFAAALPAIPAQAAFIVNTGAGDPDASGGRSLGNYSDGSFQWLGGRFVTDQTHTIASIEGWISEAGGGTISLAVYGGDNPVNPFAIPRPDTSNEVFRQSFATVFEPGSPRIAWQGVTGMSLTLDAGVYWIALEVLNQGDFGGYMPFDAPNPLDNYAFLNDGVLVPDWNPRDSNLGMGFRVATADVTGGDVPEPMSMLLLGAGLGGLAAGRASRKATRAR